jgi:diguanylate cyclase (GGDEF)-like protein
MFERLFRIGQNRMPATDYVSMVGSSYAERNSVTLGAITTGLAAGAGALKTGSIALVGVAVAFVLAGVLRYFVLRSFEDASFDADDAEAASVWELRSAIFTSVTGLLHGVWCFIAFAVVRDEFVELSSAMVSIGILIGASSRNFAIDRIVVVSSSLVAGPLALGLLISGSPYHQLMALLLLPFLISIRRIAAKNRETLLAAQHGRQEASRLAAELETALATMPHGLCLLDEHGRVTVANSRAAGFFRLRREDLEGLAFDEVVAQSTNLGALLPAAVDRMMSVVARGEGSTVILGGEGQHFNITAAANSGHTVVLIEDVTERILTNERISYMARYDSLTGLPNRAHFGLTLDRRIQELQDGEHRHFTLMILDLDDFKHVNDTYGHLVGDAVLKVAATRIREVVGADAFAARFGGDEFALLWPGGMDQMLLEVKANRLIEALSAPITLESLSLQLGASIGMAETIGSEALDGQKLMQRADLALYGAKSQGKRRWLKFQDQMEEDYQYRQQLKTDLRRAIAEDQLTLVYQPIIDIRSNRLVGCEALARWRHPVLGPISPAEFVPIADEIGASADLSRWVLRTATAECLTWPNDAFVAVNISAADFATDDVSDMVMDALAVSGLPPERLEVEITETALLEEKDRAVSALTQLHQHKIGIALDDFGTGYSSLSYLQVLPFTKLKIDRSFVTDILVNPRSSELVFDIAKLAKHLQMTVVVEGVAMTSTRSRAFILECRCLPARLPSS